MSKNCSFSPKKKCYFSSPATALDDVCAIVQLNCNGWNPHQQTAGMLLKKLRLQVKSARPNRGTYVSPQQVFVCQHQGQALSALYGKPRPLPYCHTRCSCVQGVSIHHKTLQISLAVTVCCCHTLESHSGTRWVLRDDSEACAQWWEEKNKKITTIMWP